MSEESITAANFLPSSAAKYRAFIAGATLTRGQAYYLDSAANYVAKLAQHDGTAAESAVVGVVASDVASGQRGQGVVEDPDLNPGFTVAVGITYVLGATAGAWENSDAAVGSADHKTILGVGKTTSTINFRPLIAGAPIA